jgi:hypothetical protein
VFIGDIALYSGFSIEFPLYQTGLADPAWPVQFSISTGILYDIFRTKKSEAILAARAEALWRRLLAEEQAGQTPPEDAAPVVETVAEPEPVVPTPRTTAENRSYSALVPPYLDLDRSRNEMNEAYQRAYLVSGAAGIMRYIGAYRHNPYFIVDSYNEAARRFLGDDNAVMRFFDLSAIVVPTIYTLVPGGVYYCETMTLSQDMGDGFIATQVNGQTGSSALFLQGTSELMSFGRILTNSAVRMVGIETFSRANGETSDLPVFELLYAE